jgi:hypothetical protein
VGDGDGIFGLFLLGKMLCKIIEGNSILIIKYVLINTTGLLIAYREFLE